MSHEHYLSFSLFLSSPFSLFIIFLVWTQVRRSHPVLIIHVYSSGPETWISHQKSSPSIWWERGKEKRKEEELFVINLVGLFCSRKSSTIKLCTATRGWHVASSVYWWAEHTSSCMDLVSPIWNSGLVCPWRAFTFSHHSFSYKANSNRLCYMIKYRQFNEGRVIKKKTCKNFLPNNQTCFTNKMLKHTNWKQSIQSDY